MTAVVRNRDKRMEMIPEGSSETGNEKNKNFKKFEDKEKICGFRTV